MQWDEGKDSFAKDPPNATISVLGSDGSIEDAVVKLKSPKLEGGNLTFDVAVLEGSRRKADGPASLFIDWFAAHGPHGGYAYGGWLARSGLARRLVRAPGLLWRGGRGCRRGDRRGRGLGLSSLLSAVLPAAAGLRLLPLPTLLLSGQG